MSDRGICQRFPWGTSLASPLRPVDDRGHRLCGDSEPPKSQKPIIPMRIKATDTVDSRNEAAQTGLPMTTIPRLNSIPANGTIPRMDYIW
jgi:hypothetical protein